MKVRNIIHKAAVLGSAGTMMGATVMGALAYDLADYPAQYIVDGNFDGKIVVGEMAATGDVLGSVDIAASLQARSITSEEVPGAGNGEVSLTGDVFRLETGNDLLELREPVGDVYDTLTESELDALMGGTITTDQESTSYNQYLRFADSNSADMQVMAVNYGENEEKELATWLVVDRASTELPFFEWEIEFTEGLESEVDGGDNTAAGELVDLEDEVFNIFGTDFTFVDSSWDGTDGLTLEFMAGDVSDTLREGETKTYTLDGVDYEVTAIFISDPSTSGGQNEAKFAVNGEITDSMGDGDTDTLNNGLQIGVRDLLVNSREGVVEFFLGADKVEFTDDNVGDSAFDSSSAVEIGTESIEDAEVRIDATQTGSANLEITSIKYRLIADAETKSDIYVPEGAGVREFLKEPQGMLSPTFDIRFEGMKNVATTPVLISANGDDEYEATMTSVRGHEYTWPLVSNDPDLSGVWEWGSEDDKFWFTERDMLAGFDETNITDAVDTDFYIKQDDYFLLSEGSTAVGVGSSEKDDSSVWIYSEIETDDNLLTFVNVATDEEKTVQYSDLTGNTDVLGYATNFNSDGHSYTVYVGNASSDYGLMIDLDGDGDLTTGAQTTFTVKGGGYANFDTAGTLQIYSDADVQGASIGMSLTTPASEFDTTTVTDGELSWNLINRTNNEVGLNTVAYSGPLENSANDPWGDWNLEDGKGDNDFGMTDYGALVEVDDPEGTDQAESLTISYPASQVGAQVFVVAGVTERTGADGAVMRDVVNPISVGMAVLDSDADGMLGSENLIIVGGPCANSVANAFLDNPANCGEGFEPGKAMISAKEYGSTVAILVAGYEAQETLGASYVLADYMTYLADVEGSEVEVVATDLSDLQVSSPAAE